MQGIKHLVQCHCVLPQYRNRKVPVFHKFVVFSIIDDSDKVQPKLVSCNNCGVVHKVIEIGKSEISTDRQINSALSKDDIRTCLPENICKVLDSYNVDLTTWEEVQFAIDNQKWGSTILLKKDEEKDIVQGKILTIMGATQFRIESFTHDIEVRKDEQDRKD